MNREARPQAASSLKKRIDQDLKEALKKKDASRLSVLRMLKSDIKYKEIDKGSELSDDEVLSVLASSMKKRRDSIEQFEKGGRDDLASREKAELEVVLRYVPEQLTESELLDIIARAIKDVNATGPSSLGMVMKEIMPKVRGRADGKTVNQIVSSQLQQMSES